MALHIAVSIFTTFFVCQETQIPAEGHHFAFAVLFGLLPDLDAVLEYHRTQKVAAHALNPKDHRDGVHYPLIVLPCGTIVLWVMLGNFWGLLFLVSCGAHFILDSFGPGWGIKWFYPLSNHSFKLFADKTGAPSKKLLVSWGPIDLRQAIIAYGDKNWFSKYVRSKQFFFEFALMTMGYYLLK